ncbi:MAG: family 10 glycosylhydrolase, partial [Clostridia bacterium]|nr:family 10 glycosylhydrolase [Clostridia bacterium]
VVAGRVVRFGKNNHEIPEGGYVISGHGKAAGFLSENACFGAKVVRDPERQTVGFIVDGETKRQTAEDRRRRILDRSRILTEKGIPFDSESVGRILTEASALVEEGREDDASRLLEDAYYLTAETAEGEVRAVWHRPHEKTFEEVDETVRRFAEAGFNLFLLETNYEGYATTAKLAHPWLPVRKGFEDFDVLDAFIRAGKARGVRMHVWFEDFFYGVTGTGCPMMDYHPEYMAVRKDGGLLHDAYDTFYFLNPAMPEVHSLLLDEIREILDNYDFDGFQLDYIRYPVIRGVDRSAGFEPYTLDAFRKETGIDVREIEDVNTEEWKSFTDWRTGKITDYVRSVRELILEYRAAGRHIELSTAVFGVPGDAIRLKCQDWGTWVKNGWLDAIYPMAYLNDAEDVGEEVRNMVVHYGESPNISGLAPMYNHLPYIETTKQVEECRKAGAKGVAFFCAGSFDEEQLKKLKIGVFR